MKHPIRFTQIAIQKIKKLVEQSQQPVIGLRIKVQSGGCSGYKYLIEYAKEISDFDETIILDPNITVLIDKKAVLFLIGSEMDYVQEQFKSGFVFNNPQEKHKCGCGKSFGV